MTVPGLRERLAALTPAGRTAFLADLGAEELQGVLYDWEGLWARPEQLPPDDGDWTVFLYLAGRGSGKTRAAAEWVRRMAREHPGCRLAVVARTSADCRDVCVEGESGLLAVHPPAERPLYEPSKRRLTWRNGSQANCYSADEPDLLRGPQHTYAWCDEAAAWERLTEAWANLQLGLRVGDPPRCVVTTTPRPLPLLRELLKAPTTLVRRGSTFDNAANLAPSALAEFRSRYEGTRLGRQELHGELLDDVDGALWNRAMIDGARVAEAPELVRVVVAVDPAVTSGEDADETGIVVAGRAASGHIFVLTDLSCRLSPDGWAKRVVGAYREWKCDRVIGETNNGGDMVEHTLRSVDGNVPFRKVTATRGKRVRAEPIAALYEQGKVHHVGAFPELEDQMCTFAPDVVSGSPDRLDALVWGLADLSVSKAGLVAPSTITAAQTRDVEPWLLEQEASCWGLSARGESAILQERVGPVGFAARGWAGRSPQELAGAVAGVLSKSPRPPDYLFVDRGGAGVAVVEALQALGWTRGLLSVDFAAEPDNAAAYADAGSEMYARLSEWLGTRGCLPSDCGPLADQLAGLPAPVQKPVGGMTVTYIDGGEHPAALDALALTFRVALPLSRAARAALPRSTRHRPTWRERVGREG